MNNIKHVVISLMSEKKRRKDIYNNFASHNLEFMFFDAIIGANLNLAELGVNDSPYERKLSNGEVGCYLSHICVINDFLLSDADYIIIYEDDVTITNDYNTELNKIVKYLDGESSLDLLLLGYRNEYLSFWGRKKLDNELSFNRFCDYGWGAHGYLLTRKGANNIIKYFSEPLIPYDCVTGGYTLKYPLWSDIKLNIFALSKCVIKLNEDNSSISTITDRDYLVKRRSNFFMKNIISFIKRIKPL